jgi:type II secretory pathway pseudopilin PulG
VKRFFRVIGGVTLLEVMLVLAIAAMIIVMSVRYYQSATSSQQANAILGQLQAIVAGADSLAQATGSYKEVNASKLEPMLPAAGLNTPWGTKIVITPADSSIGMQIPKTPSAVCLLLLSRLALNNHYSSAAGSATAMTPSTCKKTADDITVYYLANP